MTLDLDLIPDGGISWLDASGPESHIVLSTRVRLARNVAGRVFTGRADESTLVRNLDDVIVASRESQELHNAVVIRLDELSPLERHLLHERHLVSKELVSAGGEGRSSSALVTNGRVGVMVNEEDHLRFQCLRSGFALREAYGILDAVDSDMGRAIDFAYHPEFGYLTSCPTNAGTGLRASVLIHLPGLVLTKEIGKVLQGLSQVGLTFRGLYGEGSEVVGNFFQLSNQTTLGQSETDLLNHLDDMVRKVIEYEQEARFRLQTEAPTVTSDKVWRAYGLLRYARSLSFEETMNLLSGVRLGVGMNMISQLSVYTLNKLLIFSQSAHLAMMGERDPSSPELGTDRAAFVRHALEEDAERFS